MQKAAISGLLIVLTLFTFSVSASADNTNNEIDNKEVMTHIPNKPIKTTKYKFTDSYVDYTEDDYQLLSHLVMAEVGGEYIIPTYNLSEDEFNELQRVVASVVLNRVNDERFPNTIYDVVYDDRYGQIQYSPAHNGRLDNEPTERVYDNVKYVLENGSICPEGVIYQSSTEQGTELWKQIANQYFCIG
jgi:spore germination cell wall hydrolase CwlJ-like protein